MSIISISFNTIPESHQVIEISDDKPVHEILPNLLQLARRKNAEASLDNCVIVIGRVIDKADLETTLSELGIRSGDFMTLMQLDVRSSSVSLVLSSPRDLHPPFHIRHSPATLGRGNTMDINIGALLGSKEKTVSRHQATFFEENGEWAVRLAENATAPMFVNSQKVTADAPIVLSENSVIAFGASPNEPNLQLEVHLQHEG